jgi:hypothetical protein
MNFKKSGWHAGALLAAPQGLRWLPPYCARWTWVHFRQLETADLPETFQQCGVCDSHKLGRQDQLGIHTGVLPVTTGQSLWSQPQYPG